MAGAEAYLPLLRMSIGLQKEAGEPVKEMDPERKEWLKEAMANVLKNPVDDMKLVLKRINEENATENDKVEALQRLSGFVEQIDLAKDLHKIGGLKVMVDLLEDTSDKVRASAAHVIGTVVHNNPEPQKWASDLGALEAMTKLLSRPDATPQELAKAMYGVSSLIRHNDAGTVKFVKDLKGVAIILGILKRDSYPSEELLPSKRKAAFTLLYLVTRAPAIVPSTALHCVPVVTAALKTHVNDPDLRENALMILRVYSANDKVQLPLDNKKEAAEETSKALQVAKKEEHESAIEVCQEILAAWRI